MLFRCSCICATVLLPDDSTQNDPDNPQTMNAPASAALLSALRDEAELRRAPLAHGTPALDASAVLQVQTALLAHAQFSAAAAAFAAELATLCAATRVCLGIREHGGTLVVAVSGQAEFRRNSELCRAFAAAMDEAMEQGASIRYPADSQARPRVCLAHAELARGGAQTVVTVPLVHAGQCLGAMMLEFPTEQSPAAGLIDCLEQLASLAAPVLELKRAADRPWHGQLRLAAGKLAGNLTEPGNLATKLAGLVLVLLLVAVCAWPVTYRVSAPARLEGEVQRMVVAPADGYLRQVHAKPGDAVASGQVLVELADQDLTQERRKWTSELAQLDSSARTALARSERTQYVVTLSKADAARAQLALVEQQLARSQIRAPFDGIVIKGDLSQALGAPVQRGDVLLTLAPADAYRLIIEVDERDIGDVRAGQTGAVALAALPHATSRFRVVRVTPLASSKDGRNYYEVEARFDTQPVALRPGLQGVAKIDAGEQSLAWVWTHRLTDWARLTLWSFGS